MRQQARREVIVGANLIHGRVFSIDVKKVFNVFLFLSRFYVFSVFLFSVKNVENLLSVQANSEISVLHFTNDTLNCSGLLLLSTIFVACWAYYNYKGRHLSLSVRQKITVNVFYSTFTNGFLFLLRFLRF